MLYVYECEQKISCHQNTTPFFDFSAKTRDSQVLPSTKTHRHGVRSAGASRYFDDGYVTRACEMHADLPRFNSRNPHDPARKPGALRTRNDRSTNINQTFFRNNDARARVKKHPFFFLFHVQTGVQCLFTFLAS